MDVGMAVNAGAISVGVSTERVLVAIWVGWSVSVADTGLVGVVIDSSGGDEHPTSKVVTSKR